MQKVRQLLIEVIGEGMGEVIVEGGEEGCLVRIGGPGMLMTRG